MDACSRSVFPKLCLLLAALPHLLHAQTTVTLSASPNPSIFGAPVVLSATVTPTATGRVTFYDGVTVLGTKPLVSGAASISTIALPAGSRKLRAYYAGDATHAAVTSNIVAQTVNAQPSAGLVARSPLSAPAAAVFAVADLNGDGFADLVMNDGSAFTIGVLLGKGNGTLQSAPIDLNLGSGFIVGGAAVGDFNDDGIPDLALTSSLANGFKILLGNGDGTFQPLPTIPFPVPRPLVVADFNGDGKADLLLLNNGNGGISIFLGNGDGTFQSPIAAVPSTIFSVALGDFNGDGKTDLAVYDQNSSSVRILLGKGDGTFQQSAAYPSSFPFLAVGDFNGDGKADLAIALFNNPTQIVIMLGNGDGTFKLPVSFPAGQGLLLSVGDMNGDGKLDLVLSGNPVTVLLGNGDGTFQAPVFYPTTFNASSLIVGEFNGDGRTDLVLDDGNFLLGTTVSVTPTAGNPQSTVALRPFPSALQVTVKDGANPIAGVSVTFTAPVTVSGPTADLSSATALTDANGVASVTATANGEFGQYYVTAAALGVPTLFALTNLTGAPLVISGSSGTPQQALLGATFPKPLTVTLTDSNNSLPATGVPVTFTVAPSGASATLSSGTVLTDASGTATVTATANNIPGTYTVTATAGSLSATFSLTNLRPATVTLFSSANPSPFGSPLTLIANVTNAASTGRVTFFDGVNIVGIKPLNSGSASLSTILLSAGSHKLTAYYRDDVNFIAGTSNAVTETVNAVAGAALAAQTPVSLPATPNSVVVGDFNGDGKADFATLSQDTGSWWQVDLGAPAAIGSIVIWNRTDCCSNRLADYWVFASNTPFSASDTPATLQNRAGTFSSHQTTIPSPSVTISVNGAQARYVRVQLSAPGYLSLAEVQVFGAGAQASTNLALHQAATQSTTLLGIATAGAASAVDGNTDGTFYDGSVTATSLNVVAVALGKGDGTFQPAVNYVAPSGIIASGDFDGDGNTDLAIVNITPGDPFGGSPSVASVTILLGNGDGTFRLEGTYQAGDLGSISPLGPSFGGIVVGDLNGDGKADIVIGASYVSGSGSFSFKTTVVILLPGDGDGTFGAPISYVSVAAPFVIADFNGDGKADLAGLALSNTLTPASPQLSVTLGNGDGTGTAVASNVVASGPLLAGDFNGDGKTDLAIKGAILLGNGDGTFQSPITYTGTAVATGDFNGDGILDLVVVDSSGNLSGVLYGNGDGTFRQGLSVQAGAPLAVADFNGDGRADILTATSNGALVVLGATTAPPITLTAAGGTPQSASVGTAFAAPLQVTVMNNGVPVSGATVTFAAPTAGASAVLSSSTATTNASGVASVTAMANSVAGSYVVTASYQGNTASFSLINTTYAFIIASAGTPQSASLGGVFPNALQATVKDVSGNPVSGVTVTFTAPASGASATLSSGTAVTNASGIASVTATANNISGTYTVTASVGALSASFSLTNTGGQSASIAATGGTLQSAALNTAFPNALQATVRDSGGNPVSGATVSFAAPSNGPSATLSSATALTNAAGVASVTATANGLAGSYSVTATLGSLTTFFSLTNLSGTGGSSNLAVGKTATQSSTLPGFAAAAAGSAVDGNTDGSFFDGSVTATNLDSNAWWQVDLGASASVSSVVVWNRTDCCASRLGDYWVFISDTPFLATDTPATLQNRAATFGSHQTTAPNPSATIAAAAQGRYVRVQLTGADYLSLAEVQVFGTGAPAVSNLAQGKAATESSTLPGVATAVAGSAVDGNPDGAFYDGSVTATNLDPNPWWQVDLGASASVSSIVIWNRTDCCGGRLSDYWVFVSDTPFLATDTPSTLQGRAGTFASHQTSAPNPSTTIAAVAQGRYVRVQLTSAGYLSLAEVQVFGTGAPAISNLAQGKAATESSVLPGTPAASAAVDGNPDGNFYDGSVTATNLDANPWWQVDLGASASVSSIVVWNRTDCCGSRLGDYWVFVSDTPFLATDTATTLQGRAGTFGSHQSTAPNPSTTIAVGAQGRYVRVQLTSAGYLSLAEVQVFGQ